MVVRHFHLFWELTVMSHNRCTRDETIEYRVQTAGKMFSGELTFTEFTCRDTP